MKLKRSNIRNYKMSESLDILSIHSNILNKFDEEQKNLPPAKTRLKELELTAKMKNLPHRSRNELEQNILNLKHSIWKLETNQEKNFYISETVEILEKYKKILKTPIKISFLNNNDTSINNKEKDDLIAKYLKIASKYTNIVFKTEKSTTIKIECENCSNKKDFIIEENFYICSECGAQQDVLQYTSSYKDSDRVNISAKYTYDRKVHFRDCINQYQGKQNCTIDQKVYNDLEAILDRHHLLVGDKTTKKEIRFSKITREHILMFLKELGYSKHYENVILIHYNLTGKKPDDISHLEDKLMHDFDLLVETYDKHFKNKVERVNFISTQYVLYQLLLKHKHPCRKEDFVILKTMDRKTFHDSIMKELCSHLGWNFTPLV